MKLKLLTWALVLSIPITAIIGAGSIYLLNESLQKSHMTTYTNEEEIAIYDRIIEMADKNEIEASLVKKAFISQKTSRIAAHKIMDGSIEIRNKVIVALILSIVLQLSLLHSYIKKSNEV